MSFKVLHRGYQHIRLSSSFSLTLDIQDYLRSLARDEKGIESIQFYMDQQHFTLRIKEGFSVLDNAEAFLKRIDKGKVSELMTLPIRREEVLILLFQVQRLSVYFFVVLCRILFAIYGLVIRLWVILEKPIKH